MLENALPPPARDCKMKEYAMNTPSSSVDRDVASRTEARSRIEGLTNHVRDLEAAVRTTEANEAKSRGDERCAWLLLVYLNTANFLRTATSRVFDWRWAGALIGTVCVGGPFLAATMFVEGRAVRLGSGGRRVPDDLLCTGGVRPAPRIQGSRDKWSTSGARRRECAAALPSLQRRALCDQRRTGTDRTS